MADTCATVKIKGKAPGGYVVINAEDFKAGEHILFVESEASAEPAEATELKGKLPEGFPGLAALNEAGIHTYAQLRKAGDVTDIPNIGDKTAAKIAEALATAED